MPEGSQLQRLAPQPEIAQSFVALLTGVADPVVRLRFLHDSDRANASQDHDGTISQLWTEIVAFQERGYGVFYFLNECKPGPGSGKGGCTNDDDVLDHCRALATDHDDGLPDDWEWHVHPRIIVHTSKVTLDGIEVQKGQALWPVADLSKTDFKAAQRRLAAHYRSDTCISNPSRVLRLPGTLHLKDRTNPQLVTFEDCSATCPVGRTVADVLADLPLANEAKSDAKPSAAVGAPVSREHLRTILGYCDPDRLYPKWRNIVAAIRATPLPDDPDESERRSIAHAWSRGELDKDGRFAVAEPSRYDGVEAVDKVFDGMPPKTGGVSYGTIYHAAKAGGFDGPSAQQSAVEAFGALAATTEGAVSLVPAGSAKPFLMTEKDIFDWPDPEELIEGFLIKGENVCFYGPPKVGKTFIALDIALSVAAGLKVFGEIPTNATGAVVYLSGEGHAGMKRRIKAWRNERGISDDVSVPFYYKAAVPQTKAGMDEARRYIDGILGQLGDVPVLVVIDTMARSMAGLDENSSGDAGQYLGLTETLRLGLDCTILTLAHAGKKLDHGLRGSTAFAAGFDAVWVAEMNGANRTVKLEAEYLKDAEDLGPFCFRLKSVHVDGMKLGNGAVLAFVPLAEFNKTSTGDEAKMARRRIYDALAKMGARGVDIGLTTAQLAELLAGQPPATSDRDAYRTWETAVAKEEERLDNNSRAPRGGKRPLYDGYFDRVKPDGGKRLVKRWFLPAASDASEAVADE